MWFSVVRGTLSDMDLDLVAQAFPQYQWTPLSTVISLYGAGCTDLQVQPLDLEMLVGACRWPGMGPAVERHLQVDPHYVRRILNATIWPPAGDGAKSNALLGFCPAWPFWEVGRGLASGPPPEL